MFKKITLAFLITTIAIAPANAGLLKKVLPGGLLIAGGAAVFATIQKGCHPVRDLETGKQTIVCEKSKVFEAETEKSSSTYDLRKALDEDLESNGGTPNPENCDAHHIVPKSENRPWAKVFAESSRSAINGCLDIDSALNGVYLPGKKEGAQCEGSYHKTLHTKDYYELTSNRLSDARDVLGCDGVKSELIQIKSELLKGIL